LTANGLDVIMMKQVRSGQSEPPSNWIRNLREVQMIRTTTVGSYPVPEWLSALPSEQALSDATRMVFALQRQLGIDLPVDGEFYRFDVNHPDTNG